VTTSMTPTHGEPVRHASRRVSDGDHERWLPDPSWPVPPRGWQLWAAAGSAARPGRPARDRPVEIEDGSNSHSGPPIDETVDVMSEMPPLAVLEDASFTLPTRPSARVDHERVDLLADRPARRAPEGTVAGFTVLAALVLFSCFVGGLTGGLIVIGVSTLLSASAALVQGHLSLSRVGGQRGAGVLLGAAVTALILGSVATHDRRPGVEVLPGAPVPVSSDTDRSVAYAAAPVSVPVPATSVASDTSAPRAIASPGVAAATARPATAVPSVANVPTVPNVATGPTEPVVRATDIPAAAAARSEATRLASGSPAGGTALTLQPDALSPKETEDDPAGTVGQAPKSPTGPQAPKGAKDAKVKDAKTKDAKTKDAKAKAKDANGKDAKAAKAAENAGAEAGARRGVAALPVR
jgi:hypothetical protein